MYIEGHDNLYYDDEMNIIDNWKEIKQQIIIDEREKIYKIQIGMFPQWLCGTIWDKTGAPVRGVILQSIISSILILFDFQTLLQGTILVNGITWALEFFSFIILRYREPNALRPFKICGGWFVAWFITIIKVLLIGLLMFLIIYDTPWYLYVLIGNIIIVIIWYLIYCWCWNHKIKKNCKKNYEAMDENISVVNSKLLA